ncbi:MAG: Vitamin B12 dependent methionine synthase activation subunit [Clostridia bacterium]|nr:Vitamin B12 dependent methionine synthase activation subunit [Clostridia bacterium]
MSIVLTKNYQAPPFCKKEILRYAGCKNADADIDGLLNSCIKEAENCFTYKVCYTELDLKICENLCDFGLFKVESKGLSTNLKDCKKVLLFAATVGVDIDRLIGKYSRISPSKALMFQAMGAERIEALCDLFCADFEQNNGVFLKPRFSPGYSDLSLSVQKDVFRLLDCSKNIGLSLNDSLLMSPSKSVTAFAGITDSGSKDTLNKCSLCQKVDCSFRGKI